MRVWKVRRFRYDGEAVSAEKATRKRSLLALETVREQDPGKWPTIAFYGWWLEHYEKRVCHKRPQSVRDRLRTFRDLAALRKRVGGKDTKRAIEVVFAELDWVKFDWLQFMMNQSNYDRFIVPLLDVKPKVAHDGSHWTGPVSDEASSEIGSWDD